MKFTIDKNTNIDVLAHEMGQQIIAALKSQIEKINQMIKDGEQEIDLEISVNLKPTKDKGI